MDDRALIGRLADLRPPEAESARERAIGALPERVRAARSRRRQFFRYISVRAATATAVLLVAFAAFSIFTSPGKAFTSWVGDQLGIGQPGGTPSLQPLRESWDQGTPAAGRPAHVLHVGPAPGGRYEFITYRPRLAEDGRGGGAWPVDEPCFEVDLTQLRVKTGQDCGVLPGGSDLYLTSGAAGETLFFSGRTSSAVKAVEARLDGEAVPVELAPIPASLIERFDLGRPFSFFIIFLNEVRDGGTLTVTARDSTGRILDRQDAAVPNVARAQEAMCEMAKRLLREGVGSRQNALRNVRASCQDPRDR